MKYNLRVKKVHNHMTIDFSCIPKNNGAELRFRLTRISMANV